ncbi:uncharacterized protein LOC132303164 isoform X1 [Cornus florida]|uniref:uncharacterized protein LOC132303164 isoform X1 n=1 Tax=Cornus florida TaxID=4283 RepID=UPI00289B1DD7|nr:uncharacterized protein LOC132303164 isoform X1 [Cornus florida]
MKKNLYPNNLGGCKSSFGRNEEVETIAPPNNCVTIGAYGVKRKAMIGRPRSRLRGALERGRKNSNAKTAKVSKRKQKGTEDPISSSCNTQEQQVRDGARTFDFLTQGHPLACCAKSPLQSFSGPRLCCLCQSIDESHDHLFFVCSFTNPIWRFLQIKCRIRVSHLSWNGFIAWASNRWRRRNLQISTNLLVLSTIVNRIWTERNDRIFRGQRNSQSKMLRNTMDMIKQRMISMPVKDSALARRLALDWELPPSFIRPPPEPD